MNLLKNVELKKKKTSYSEFVTQVEDEQNRMCDQIANIKNFWEVPRQLKQKVGQDRQFRDFFGDTVISPIEKDEISVLENIRDKFRGLDIFAEEIISKTFHITIHDLSSGKRNVKLEEKVKSNEEKCREIIDELKNYFEKKPDEAIVKLRSTRIYPVSNIALLVGFNPVTDRDYKIMLNLYQLFENVQFLRYAPRFHVTLNYFQSRSLKHMEIEDFEKVLLATRDFSMELTLDLKRIEYQHFLNMNHYECKYKI
ncbi:MAG: hypothetical protein KAQ98_06735 [Bacteriovoracaceae bacterium]|nr:hypothetical protein [Bacteriovoracaceae bacterium]